mgnify:FL=1
MPNHCDQTVTIHGPRALVSQLHDSLDLPDVGDRRFCDLISPMPFEMWVAPEVTMPKPFEITMPAWREWRDEHWGTKWDVCGVENVHYETPQWSSEPKLTFKCWTAWSPPIPVWDRLVDLGCRVSAEYEDEGWMFKGTYEDGLDQCWEPTALEDERWEPEEDDMGDEDEAWEEEEV